MTRALRRTRLLPTLRNWFTDRLAPQIDAYSWHRYSIVAPLLMGGDIRSLNIGTGGGIETLRLLTLGNRVTTIEINPETASRTRERIERWGYGDRHTGLVGHMLEVELPENFDQIVMCEVLEHISDDETALRRIGSWLKPGGQLVLSTPTRSYGQLPGDTLSTSEDGGHVRPGYDGPELDAMLARAGLTTVNRIFLCGLGPTVQHLVERQVRRRSQAIGAAVGLASRPLVRLLDLYPVRPTDQITVARKMEPA